jgi:dihydroflavonol-4-reductase
MKVLLTGATGFLGSEIARELVRQGHTVRALVRPTSRRDALAGLPIEAVVGDIRDAASVEAALEGVQALIHTAGATSARPRDAKTVMATNVEGTRTVLAAAARRPGLRVVYTSTIATIGATHQPRVLDEHASYNMAGTGFAYADSKKAAEEVALAHGAAGMNLVILCPGTLFGPGDIYITSTRYVLEYLRGRNRFIAAGGLSFGDVREVARAHVAALTKGRAGERYIVAGQNRSHAEALAVLHRVTGLYRPLRLPHALFFAAALLSEAAARIHRHGLEELSRGVVAWARRYAFMDSGKAQRELDYVVRPFDETVRDTVRDFVQRGLVLPRTSALAGMVPGQVTAGS